jgi:hypothetical protein
VDEDTKAQKLGTFAVPLELRKQFREYTALLVTQIFPVHLDSAIMIVVGEIWDVKAAIVRFNQ